MFVQEKELMNVCKVIGSPICHCDPYNQYDKYILAPRSKDTMRKLFTDHAVYIKMYLVAFLDDRPEADLLSKRLFENQIEIGVYLGMYLGRDIGTSIGNLFTAHIKAIAQVLVFLKTGRRLDKALESIYRNIDELASALSRIQGSILEYGAVRIEFARHNEFIVEIARFHYESEYSLEIEKYDEFFVHMMKFSDILCDGLIH